MNQFVSRSFALACLVGLAACATSAPDYETLFVDLAQRDVVFLGEQHDNAIGHAWHRHMLENLHEKRGDVVLSMEMFERDVQPVLDDYLAGRIEE